MIVGEICTRSVVTCTRGDTVLGAAYRMCHYHVGAVVVVTEDQSGHKPVGIVTDRDIVIGIVAAPRGDPERITLGDICSRPMITVHEQTGILEAMQLMRQQGIRRLPVQNADGILIGIVTADDLMRVIAKALGDLSTAITREQSHEAKLHR